MAAKIHKTNAMRMLDRAKVEYKVREFPDNMALSAVEVAQYLGEQTDRVFKTLVTTDNHNGFYVFCIPGDHELSLKAAAKTAGVKKLEMLKQKDLFSLTGYVHGGCSPVGMKKQFFTAIDETALNWETIYVSAGKIGLQLEIQPKVLGNTVKAIFAALTQ